MARTKEQNDRRYMLARLGERLSVSPEATDVHVALLGLLVVRYPEKTRDVLRLIEADEAADAAAAAAASSPSPAGEIAPAPEAG